MILTKNKFLNSHKTFDKNEFYLQSNYQAANILLSIYNVTFSLLVLIHGLLGEYMSAVINIIALSISICGIVIVRLLDKKYFYYLAHTLFVSYLVLILYAFYIKDIEFPVSGWTLILILSIFFVFNNQKIVYIYMFIFFVSFFTMVINIDPYLNFEHMINFMFTVFIGSLNIYLYYYRSNIIFEKLKDVNTNLENKIKVATLEKTNALEQEKQKLIYLNNHDYLTTLPNIIFFEKELSTIVKEKRHSLFALIYIDLNLSMNFMDIL